MATDAAGLAPASGLVWQITRVRPAACRFGHVEPVGAELEPGGAVGAGDFGGAQCGDLAGLLAVEHDQAAGEAVAGREGVIDQAAAGSPEPVRRAGLDAGVH